jgi:hypothetical protein
MQDGTQVGGLGLFDCAFLCRAFVILCFSGKHSRNSCGQCCTFSSDRPKSSRFGRFYSPTFTRRLALSVCRAAVAKTVIKPCTVTWKHLVKLTIHTGTLKRNHMAIHPILTMGTFCFIKTLCSFHLLCNVRISARHLGPKLHYRVHISLGTELLKSDLSCNKVIDGNFQRNEFYTHERFYQIKAGSLRTGSELARALLFIPPFCLSQSH